MTTTLEQHNVRFRRYLPASLIQSTRCYVVGCGAGGSALFRSLNSMGFPLTLIDHDIISTENIGSQGWHPSQIGQAKVHTLEDANVYPGQVNAQFCRIEEVDPEHLGLLPSESNALWFSCVDSPTARRHVSVAIDHWMKRQYHQSTPPEKAALFDGRALLTQGRLLAFPLLPSITSALDEWESTIPSESDAAVPDCADTSIIYASYFSASILAHLATQYLLGHLTKPIDLTWNLFDPIDHVPQLYPTPPDQPEPYKCRDCGSTDHEVTDNFTKCKKCGLNVLHFA